jgi:hypothetical protein
MLLFEIERAKRELEQARQDFDWAIPDCVDAAAFRLEAAEVKLNYLLREAKREAVTV